MAFGEGDRGDKAAAQFVSGAELQAVASRICAARGFALGRKLGQGAFKETYLATVGGKHFALKVVRANADPKRTGREIKAMLRCKHPGIAVLQGAALERVDKETFCWLLEEYLDGGSLDDRLKDTGILPVEELRNLGSLVLDALDYLRSASLVHRDLKPANIMYRADGTPVLVDFGLVRDLNEPSLTETWADMGPGTPFYAPLEQLQNRKELIDWRSDQYSLGVVLAMSGFGRHPLADEGEPPPRTVQKVIERAKPTAAFITWANNNGLAAVEQMTRTWPYERFRTPDLLRKSWGGA